LFTLPVSYAIPYWCTPSKKNPGSALELKLSPEQTFATFSQDVLTNGKRKKKLSQNFSFIAKKYDFPSFF